jgi:hypothetical protein
LRAFNFAAGAVAYLVGDLVNVARDRPSLASALR